MGVCKPSKIKELCSSLSAPLGMSILELCLFFTPIKARQRLTETRTQAMKSILAPQVRIFLGARQLFSFSLPQKSPRAPRVIVIGRPETCCYLYREVCGWVPHIRNWTPRPPRCSNTDKLFITAACFDYTHTRSDRVFIIAGARTQQWHCLRGYYHLVFIFSHTHARFKIR